MKQRELCTNGASKSKGPRLPYSTWGLRTTTSVSLTRCFYSRLNDFTEEYDDAINAWKESITLQPSSPDAHTSAYVFQLSLILSITIMLADLASAYIISPIPRPDLALQHLQYVRSVTITKNVLTHLHSIASSLAPDDPEIAFNLGAVLEACTLNIPQLNHYFTLLTGGRLEDALTYYKRSKEFGVERAAVHIRNVCSSSSTHLVAALKHVKCR